MRISAYSFIGFSRLYAVTIALTHADTPAAVYAALAEFKERVGYNVVALEARVAMCRSGSSCHGPCRQAL